MKKISLLLVFVLCVLFLCSCGEKEINNSSDKSSKVESLISSEQNSSEDTSSEDIKETVKAKANEAINSVVTSNMTEYQKLKIVYEWLFYHFKYRAQSVDLSNGYTDELTYQLANEYFKYHKGSCEHYAAAQKVLFEQLGYEVMYVEGERYSTVELAYGEHVWVMIKIDGNWYHVDGLYGGNHSPGLLTTFCVPDSALEKTHRWEKSNYPECTSPQYSK